MKHLLASWNDEVEGGSEDMQSIRDAGGCHDFIPPFYYVLSSPLLSILILSFQPFSQLYSCSYSVVGSVSKAIVTGFYFTPHLAII